MFFENMNGGWDYLSASAQSKLMTARARRCRAAPVTLHFSSQEAPGQLPPTKDEPRKNTASHDRDFFFATQ
jgi:hypothetical protein